MKNIFLALLLFCASAAQAALTLPELQKQMQIGQDKIQTLTFDFVQETVSGLDNKSKKSSGSVQLQKPRLLRLLQQEPQVQTVISDGKSVYIYTPKFNQVLKNSWDKWIETSFAFPGLADAQTLQKMQTDYIWTIQDQQADFILVQLRKPDGQESLFLWIDTQDFIPHRIEITYNTLTIKTTLSKVSINATLKPEIFKFQKPKNAVLISL